LAIETEKCQELHQKGRYGLTVMQW